MHHSPTTHPAPTGHPAHTGVSTQPIHPVHVVNLPGHIGTRTGGAADDSFISGRSSLVSHLGQQSTIHLAAARLLQNKSANPHELTWVADHHAHPLPLHHNPSRPPIHVSGSDLGTIPGRSALHGTSLSLHHTTPGGAWWKVQADQEAILEGRSSTVATAVNPQHFLALEQAKLKALLAKGGHPREVAQLEKRIADIEAGKPLLTSKQTSAVFARH